MPKKTVKRLKRHLIRARTFGIVRVLPHNANSRYILPPRHFSGAEPE